MKIGIIGAGQIGGALARRLTALNHQVLIANSRGPETLRDLADETGAKAVHPRDAAHDVDLIVLTIPMRKVETLPAGMFAQVPASVPVIDTNNYYPRERDGRIEDIEAGLVESRWVERQIGHPVIKTFNNIYARHLQELGKPKGAAGRIALPVSGDDAAAKAKVLALVDELGFDPVDVGGLDESWRQQPGTPAYGKDFDAAGVRDALNKASKARTPQWSGTASSPGSFEQPA
ncbi:MAG: NAD(P)-binding domain-containing protein [Proteobacteria bacterium]|nr:NAD(P)-binding domain-containing protein [Pseudomonadota bacterium]